MDKRGIDFFPLDVQLDDKFALIEAEFGLTGFGVIVHLLQDIYGKEGYYIEWTNDVALIFARKIGLSVGAVSEIITAAIRRGMFDREIYEKYHVLTSRGIQERYFDAVKRRKILKVKRNILLVDCAQICKDADILEENVNIFSENDNIFRQRREEKSRVEKSRVEKSKEENSLTISDDIVCPTQSVRRVISAWNELERHGIKAVTKITSGTKRHTLTQARIREYGLDTVLAAIGKIADSPFLCGNNPKGWQISYDWFVLPGNFAKVLEGNYDERPTVATQGKDSNNIFAELLAERMDSNDL